MYDDVFENKDINNDVQVVILIADRRESFD